MMEPEIRALLQVLGDQRRRLDELLAASVRQQEAILARDREAIEQTTIEQDELFAALQASEYDREQLQRALQDKLFQKSGPQSSGPGAEPSPAVRGPNADSASSQSAATLGGDGGPGPSQSAATLGGDGGPGPGRAAAVRSGDVGLDFDRLLRALPETVRTELAAARDEARSLLIQLSTQNEMNQQLLAQELALVDLYMSVLHPDMSAEAYSEPGQAPKPGASAAVAFDARV